MEELVSIIINVYNAEKYIAKCLESVINQTYRNIEIIIVNDGSTDKTLEICESYKDERIRIINQENMGLSMSRNVGIENSRGEYLYFIDADDFIDIDTIEYLYKLIKKYDVPIATANPMEISDYNYKKTEKAEKIKILSSKEMLKKILLSTDRAGTAWNKLIKRELFNNIRFEDRIINDIVVVYKIILKIDKLVCSNQKKYYYLRHEDSITGQEKPEYLIDAYKAIMERYNSIKKIYPDLIENRLAINRLIALMYYHEEPEIQKILEEQNAIKLYNEMFYQLFLFLYLLIIHPL